MPSRQSSFAPIATAIAILGGDVSQATAQAYLLERDRDGVYCVDIGNVDCSIEVCDLTCGEVGRGGNMQCHYGAHTALCCEVDADCYVGGSLVSEIGTCVRITGLTTTSGSPVFGVCEFPSVPGPMYCGAMDVTDLYECLPSLGWNWAAGNCDVDSAENVIDPAPCDDAIGTDGGIGSPDGAVPDASAPRDGSTLADGGLRDANRPGLPAPSRPDLVFRGGGGCVCAVERSAGGSLSASFFALIAVAVVARRARPSNRRRRCERRWTV